MQIGGTSQSANQSTNSSTSMSQSITYGREATNSAVTSAERANQLAMSNWREAAEFNATEAEKQRQWQTQMANTVYQRTMKDMLAAGLNPVLAAGGGLGSAAVSGGAAASMPSASTYMANTFPESQSASSSQSYGQSSGWSESLSGLAYLADAIGGAIEKITGSQKIDIAINGLDKVLNHDTNNDGEVKGDEKAANAAGAFFNMTPMQILDFFMSDSSEKRKAIYNSNNKNLPNTKNYVPYQYHNNGI